MKKIITIVGARPQFIKAAALSREMAKHAQLNEIIIHTGQHFDENMSEIFFREMEIPKPNYNLNINGLSHGAMTGQMIEGIEKIIVDEKPDAVLVYGDTNSTIAGALAAKKLHIKVAHVEAGLRSFNMQMPEEINRILTDRISDYLFCPTDTALNNLKKEGFDQFNCEVIKTGDVMEDAALFYSQKSEELSDIIDKLKLNKGGYILATIHRAENTDNAGNLINIIEALNQINNQIQVVVPLHPRTKNIIKQSGLKVNFLVIDPVGYFDMIQLISCSNLVISDSGGLQKEAFIFGKYCVTIREQTEWIELVENHYNFIVGTNKELIISTTQKLIDTVFPEKINLYGNGKASNNICNVLIKG
jgi:UDP-GlcNAc3NAcA epimerase